MSYWILLFFVTVAAYVIVDFVLMYKRKSTINVAVIDKDGNKKIVKVKKGRNPEVDTFIQKVRAEKLAREKQGRKLS